MAQNESYKGLARKWRPQRFEDLVGQDSLAQSFQSALRQGRLVHGHLLAGPRGVGKTTSARILAKALNCEQGPSPTPCGKCRHCIDITQGNDLDVIEIDAASNTGVDNIRDLRERVNQAPFASRYKVYIIDEVHMLSTGAFNALLKTLEEPPPNVIFIFATTELDKVPETIRSRCIVHAFRRLSAEDIIFRLEQVAAGEGMTADPATAREIFGLIARSVEGGMRDALVLFDQLLALTEGKPDVESALKLLGLADRAVLAQTVGWLAGGDAPALLGLIEDLVNRGRNLERYVKSLTAYLRDLMLLQAGAAEGLVALTGEALETARRQAEELSPATLFNFLNQMFELEERLKQSGQARFLLEFTFLRLAAIKPVVSLEQLIGRVAALPESTFGGPAASPAAPTAPAAYSSAPATYSSAPAAPTPKPPYQSASIVDLAPMTAAPPVAAIPTPQVPIAAPAFCDSAPAPEGATATDAINPLAGLERNAILEQLVPQLPDSARFLVRRYLPQTAAIEADGGVLCLSWPPEASYAQRTIERADNQAMIEEALTRLCDRPMRLRHESSQASEANEASIAAPPAVRIQAPMAGSAGAFLADSDPSPQPPLATPIIDESAVIPPPAAEEDFTDSDMYAASSDDSQMPRPSPPANLRPASEPATAAGQPGPGLPSPRPVVSVDRRTPMEKAQAYVKLGDDATRRLRLLRDFFSGRVIDDTGQPLSL